MTNKILIYPERDNKRNLLDNQDQNKIQIKSYILPINMNPQFQNNSTPGQPYNSMNLVNTPKNSISQDFQRSNPQDLDDPMIQPLFPPSQDNDLPIQEGLSLDNNIAQTKTPDDTPYIFQPVSPVYQAQYENIKNISEIPHKGIYEIDENTFYISTGCCSKTIPSFFFLFFGIGEFVLCYYFLFIERVIPYFLFLFFHGGAFNIIGLSYLLLNCKSAYIIKKKNSIKVINKITCRKKIKTYNIDEIERVDFSNKENCTYSLIFELTNGKKYTIFFSDMGCCAYTKEEIGYFLYNINSHIKNKMK